MPSPQMLSFGSRKELIKILKREEVCVLGVK